MADLRVEKLADILVNYCIEVKAGDWVVVNANTIALPLVRDIVRKIVQAGGHATPLLLDDQIQEITLQEATEEQLKWIIPVESLIVEEADAFISIMATDNTRSLSNVDPKKQQLRALSRQSLMEVYVKRFAEGNLRWVGTQYPCPAFAQEADMSLTEHENFVYQATGATLDDPVTHWRRVFDKQQHWVEWLKGKKELVVRGPNIDMTLSIEGRTFINDGGRNNMPGGEIFTSPVEESVNGWVKFGYPAISGGREVEGVTFKFETGKVVEATAKKGQEFLLSQLDSDEGSRYLGEFAIGTNYSIDRFTKSILYDEKIGGTVHMAVGRGFPEAGGRNKSVVHWDFICDMREDSEILVDGELFYKDGKLQV